MKPVEPLVRHLRYTKILIQSLASPLLVYLAMAGNTLMFTLAGLFYWVESPVNESVSHFFDAVWWAFSTVTTVGFGDIVPLTTEGRIIGIALMVLGIGFFVSFTAVLASVISVRTAREFAEADRPLTHKEYQEFHTEIKELLSELKKKHGG